jgi:hypothetical protein
MGIIMSFLIVGMVLNDFTIAKGWRTIRALFHKWIFKSQYP